MNYICIAGIILAISSPDLIVEAIGVLMVILAVPEIEVKDV